MNIMRAAYNFSQLIKYNLPNNIVYFNDTYNKLYIFKLSCKRLYKNRVIFNYLPLIKSILILIFSVSFKVFQVFNDTCIYSFKSGIFKQSYFLLYLKFKKRNSTWLSLLYK